MKLIIQIPCYNEEQTLPATLKDLPKQINGISNIEWLVIDDGSTDNTVQAAREHGVTHIVRHTKNLGLAHAFMTGINACLRFGADIIVNTDADNQYNSDCISSLIQPILDGKAEIVIGARPIDEVKDFSRSKKFFQKLGSLIVRLASGTDIPDATSGFRAFTKDAARKINMFNHYTYTLEMIIQAGQKNLPITWVPIKINRSLRPSRLIKSTPSYIFKSLVTIVRIFVVYRPFRFFMGLGSVLMTAGTCIGLRFLYYYFFGQSDGHIQSLILASILIGMGFQTVLIAFVVDLQSVNRRLLEKLQHSNLNQMDSNKSQRPSE